MNHNKNKTTKKNGAVTNGKSSTTSKKTKVIKKVNSKVIFCSLLVLFNLII